jgi:diadenylate cyclase
MVEPAFIDHLLRDLRWCGKDALRATIALATKIAAEGQEGRPTGALFALGDTDQVLARSRPLILDPLAGHAPHATHLDDPRLQGTIKALAVLDGAFVVALDGTVVAACRYLDVPASNVEIPMGLGSRHIAAASISKHLQVVGIVASQSGVVRVFSGGQLRAEIPRSTSPWEREQRRRHTIRR